MSDFINENPDVLEANQLPTRKGSDGMDGMISGLEMNNASSERKKLLMKMNRSVDSQIVKNIDMLDRLLILNSPVPDLISDDTESESDNTDDVKSSSHSLETYDPIDPQEIYDLTAYIQDPEHPLTLGQLSIVNLEDIEVNDTGKPDEIAEVIIRITPTITHCSLATLIGLGIRVRLDRALSPRYRITILLKKGSHQSENQVNKQLNDKERVAAACENEQLLNVISNMLSTCI